MLCPARARGNAAGREAERLLRARIAADAERWFLRTLSKCGNRREYYKRRGIILKTRAKTLAKSRKNGYNIERRNVSVAQLRLCTSLRRLVPLVRARSDSDDTLPRVPFGKRQSPIGYTILHFTFYVSVAQLRLCASLRLLVPLVRARSDSDDTLPRVPLGKRQSPIGYTILHFTFLRIRSSAG